MRAFKYTVACAALIILSTIGAGARETSHLMESLQMEQSVVRDTLGQFNIDSAAAIASRITNWLDSQLVLTDKQYKRVHESIFKEVVLFEASGETLVVEEAQKEMDKKMKRFLKEYQYKLYLEIRDNIYAKLKEEAGRRNGNR